MKRSPFDVLRRGLDNTVANWGAIVVRLVETIVFVFIAAATAIAVVMPILVMVGIELGELNSPENVESAMLALLERWTLLLWIFAAVCIVVLLFTALHSFVEAGCARVYVDGEQAAGPLTEGPRTRYRVFSVSRWMAGARAGWWTVFWIYNFAWGVAGLILLIPLLPTLAVTLMFRDRPAVAITGGCLGLVLTLLLMIVVGIVTAIWTNRAIADWAVHATGAATSLSVAWRVVKADLGRHLLVAVAMMFIALAGSSFFASFSWMAAFGQAISENAIYNIFTLPLRFAGSMLSTVFSAFVSSWYLAAYTALAVEQWSGGLSPAVADRRPAV